MVGIDLERWNIICCANKSVHFEDGISFVEIVYGTLTMMLLDVRR